MSNNTTAITEVGHWDPISTRGYAGAISAWAKVVTRSAVLRVKPQASLFSGSVLVLITLVLPVAYDACGPNRTGMEVLSGEGIWPGALAFGIPYVEMTFYAVALGFAAFTLALLLLSFFRPQILQSRRLTNLTFAFAGTLSLYVVADFFWVLLGFEAGNRFFAPLGFNDGTTVAIAAGAIILVLASRLRARFLRTERWALYLVGITAAASLLVLADFFASQFSWGKILGEDFSINVIAASSMMYWLIPAVLWHRMGRSNQEERQAQWKGIRLRILQMFVPLAVIDCLFLAKVVTDGLWGFLSLFIGIQLLAFGYMQLAREANDSWSARETAPAH